MIAAGQVSAFLAAVEGACDDLAVDDRSRVVAVAASYLDDRAGDEGVDLTDPREYAREVRAALGLPDHPSDQPSLPRRSARTHTRPLVAAAAVLFIASAAALVVAMNRAHSASKARPDSAAVPFSTGTPTAARLSRDQTYLGPGLWTIKVNHVGAYNVLTAPFEPQYPLHDYSASMVLFDASAEYTDERVQLVDAGAQHYRLRITVTVNAFTGKPVLAITAMQPKPPDSRGSTKPRKPAGASRTGPRQSAAALGPPAPPPVRIRPLSATGRTLNGQPILAYITNRRSATVKAHLYFLPHGRGNVLAAALVIRTPGTGLGVNGSTGRTYYKNSRVALGPRVAANYPEQQTLTVTTPPHLRPGAYPVLYVETVAQQLGQKPGRPGTFVEAGQIGVVVVR